MLDSRSFNHELLGQVMGLILNDEFYAESLVHLTRNSVYYAVKHGKCFAHRVDGEVVGYGTWGFFTRKELDEDLWNGDEVYARAWSPELILFFPEVSVSCGAARGYPVYTRHSAIYVG